MRINSKTGFIFLISWHFYFATLITLSFALRSCKIDAVFSDYGCDENETCKQQGKKEDGICDCSLNFHYENGICIADPAEISEPTKDSIYKDLIINKGSSAKFWMLIPVFILATVGASFLLIKRLKLIEKLYQFRVRRYNNVFVSSFQDDDAPIT